MLRASVGLLPTMAASCHYLVIRKNKNLKNLPRQCEQSQGLRIRRTAMQSAIQRLPPVRFCWLVSAFADSLKWAGPVPSYLVNSTGCETQDGRERQFSGIFSSASRRKLWKEAQAPAPQSLGFQKAGWCRWVKRKNCWRDSGLKHLDWNHASQLNPAKLGY